MHLKTDTLLVIFLTYCWLLVHKCTTGMQFKVPNFLCNDTVWKICRFSETTYSSYINWMICVFHGLIMSACRFICCIMLYDCLFHTVHDMRTDMGCIEARCFWLPPNSFMQFYFLLYTIYPLLMYFLPLQACSSKLLASIYPTARHHISVDFSLDAFAFWNSLYLLFSC